MKRAPKAPPKRSLSLLWLSLEVMALSMIGLMGTIRVLGHAAVWFGGSDLTESLLPFAGAVLILAISASLALTGWRKIRSWLVLLAPEIPSLVSIALLVVFSVYGSSVGFKEDLIRLRTLVGGAKQAGRDQIAHQVFAAYRKADHEELSRILSRVDPYLKDIQEASLAYRIDPDVLVGIGVTESSFLPRDSRDGGKGLFQITQIPRAVRLEVIQRLGLRELDIRSARENTFLAAATFRDYLDAMRGDLFLGLLAYNIGPRNGGLSSIMEQYGAEDFFTIQPYLKDLPGDYPIRVLSSALAFRLFHLEGALPRYEEGGNAKTIQDLGIPGFEPVWPKEFVEDRLH